MKRPPNEVQALADELNRYFYKNGSLLFSNRAREIPRGTNPGMRLDLQTRRRHRRSALDAYKSVAEAFVIRRARASNPLCFTYSRLQRLIARHADRTFSVSAIQRRMVSWGLADAMTRYGK